MEGKLFWFWDQTKLQAEREWGGGLSVDKFRLGFLPFPPQNFLRLHASQFFLYPLFAL
jgi:hypothetical protein